MFSKKTVVIVGFILFIGLNAVYLALTFRNRQASYGMEGVALTVTGPFQEVASYVIGKFQGVWEGYFFLVSVADENRRLRKSLAHSLEQSSRCKELELANRRFRELLLFKEQVPHASVAAEIIGKDPSPWFQSITIDKGSSDGVVKALPVIVPQGVVGVVTDVSSSYSKVLLISDHNSAVDALIQETRVRGIVKGSGADFCTMDYVLRRHHIEKGNVVVTSGLDGVFPKGIRIGTVTEVLRQKPGVFQGVKMKPFVNFETLEEVLIITSPAPQSNETVSASQSNETSPAPQSNGPE